MTGGFTRSLLPDYSFLGPAGCVSPFATTFGPVVDRDSRRGPL